MSTRSTIWLKVKEEDYGKVLTADITKLPSLMENFNYDCVPVKIHDCPANGLWLGIYCHFDGDPDGVGAELKKKFTTYEQVLNLILLGQCSYIIDGICAYHNWRNEPVHIYESQFGRPKCTHDFAYYFENDNWDMQELDYYNYPTNNSDVVVKKFE